MENPYKTHNNPRLSDPDTFNEAFMEQRPEQVKRYLEEAWRRYEKSTHEFSPNLTPAPRRPYPPYGNPNTGVATPVERMRSRPNVVPELKKEDIFPPKPDPNKVNAKDSNSVADYLDQAAFGPVYSQIRVQGAINSAGPNGRSIFEALKAKLSNPNNLGAVQRHGNDTMTGFNDNSAGTKVHERHHAANPGFQLGNDLYIDRIWEYFHPKDQEIVRYLVSPVETEARIKQLQFDLKLDPKHKYSLEDVKQMRSKADFGKYNLESYSDEDILDYINEVF